MAIEYKLVAEMLVSELEREVNKLLNEGWQLHGQQQVAAVAETLRHMEGYLMAQYVFTQAMTREKEQDNETKQN
jgi:hypothetical protein